MYILDPNKQYALTQQMTMLRKDDDTLEAYYHHPNTEVMWKSFFPRANSHSRGPKVLRIEPPPPQMKHWLMHCLTDAGTENARGLAIELSAEPQRWEGLMEVIEKDYRKYGRKQLRIFFSDLGIMNSEASLKELNIEPSDIDLDKKKLKHLERRIKIIRFKRFWLF